MQASLALPEITMVPENLVRSYKQNLLLLEKWETTCNEVNANNFENAAALVSKADFAKKLNDITKVMILLKRLTDGVKTKSTMLQG